MILHLIFHVRPVVAIGYTTEEILFPEYVELLDKLDTLKTKIKKMQDDVDYIKEKVG